MSSKILAQRLEAIISEMEKAEDDLRKRHEEAARVRIVVENTKEILDDLDDQFCKQTGLNKVDMAFLFTAIGLQFYRQYVLTNFPERDDDQTAAKKVKGDEKEHSNRRHRLYNPSLAEIISNPVPFDANIGANGALSGGGSMGHRATAIGHDPILGLIIGTANIATSTLTTASFASYHIYTNQNKRDYFRNNARTELVLKYTADKLLYGGNEGKIIVARSLMKEVIHLKSDLHTKNSLPLPAISAIDPKIASDLASYGLDISNVVTFIKQAAYAEFINTIIAMTHGLFFYENNNSMSRKLYEVKTRKILSYSNWVASSSNLAVVALKRDMEGLKLLDLGGLAVTIYRLITDKKFIKEVKEEFIFGGYKDMIMGVN